MGSKVNVQPVILSVRNLLKWRFVVLDDEFSTNTTCCAKLMKHQDVAPKSWREEAILDQQKSKDKKKALKENVPKISGPTHPVLIETENAWSAQQKLRTKSSGSDGKSDEQIIRDMKSILNKLTMKKYDVLYQQILSCGMSTVEHVMILIDEILEKVQSQHHFIQMYCQLCVD